MLHSGVEQHLLILKTGLELGMVGLSHQQNYLLPSNLIDKIRMSYFNLETTVIIIILK